MAHKLANFDFKNYSRHGATSSSDYVKIVKNYLIIPLTASLKTKSTSVFSWHYPFKTRDILQSNCTTDTCSVQFSLSSWTKPYMWPWAGYFFASSQWRGQTNREKKKEEEEGKGGEREERWRNTREPAWTVYCPPSTAKTQYRNIGTNSQATNSAASVPIPHSCMWLYMWAIIYSQDRSAYSADPDPGNILIAHIHMNVDVGTEAAQFLFW
jgi:hypothetical protein